MEKKWLEDYTQYLKAGSMEDMLALKQEFFPASFFKYKALSECTLDCLRSDRLWMSAADGFNDPFECSLLLDNDELFKDMFRDEERLKEFCRAGFSEIDLSQINSSSDPFGEYMALLKRRGIKFPFTRRQQMDRIEAAWEKDSHERNKNIRICCFSTTNDSILMWSHYSDAHKGICIEYDFIKTDEIRAFLQPVNYTKERPRIKKFSEFDSYNNVYAAICKSEDWEYEKEWRLTFFTESQIKGKDNFVQVPVPRAVYLGARFHLNSEKLKNEFSEIMKRKGVAVYSMAIHKSEYGVVCNRG